MDELKHNQPVRDLIEFNFAVHAVDGQKDQYDLVVELRVGQADIEEGSTSEAFTVNLKRVVLQIDLSGATINAGSKYGEPVAPNKASTKVKLTKETDIKIGGAFGGKAEGKIGQSAPMDVVATADAKLAAERKVHCVAESEREHVLLRVKAIGNDRWEVAEVDKVSVLDGKVLNAEILCRFTSADKANAVLIAGSILAKQKDFRFTADSLLPRISGVIGKLTRNDEKLLCIFLTKRLAQEAYTGEVCLAEKEVSF